MVASTWTKTAQLYCHHKEKRPLSTSKGNRRQGLICQVFIKNHRHQLISPWTAHSSSENENTALVYWATITACSIACDYLANCNGGILRKDLRSGCSVDGLEGFAVAAPGCIELNLYQSIQIYDNEFGLNYKGTPSCCCFYFLWA